MPPPLPPTATAEYGAMEKSGKKATRWLWFIAGAILLYLAFGPSGDRGGSCGPYNISKADCNRIKSMSQEELRESIDEDDRQQRRER
jgi:hypothetical protein